MSDYEFYRTTARPARTMGMNGREMLNMIFFVEPPRKRTNPSRPRSCEPGSCRCRQTGSSAS